ncbi:(d)CMP kinase, partial [Candidatus Binatus sp.]|uniref:(d)CMP kinase n=1 Tax=Candidatus Binatus sp. TaxID=2811406 RepID=UPI003C377C46
MSRKEPIIAIDGPVGAGKSVAARELARALGFSYLNTGAMYRAVAIAARAAGVNPDDAKVEARLASVLEAIKIRFDGEKIFLNGRDVSVEKNAHEIGDLASRFSA